MIELAVNYSPEAAAVVRAGRARPDRFKVPGPGWDDTLALSAAELPTYVHLTLAAGSGELAADWDGIDRLLAATASPYVNLHLCGVRNGKEPARHGLDDPDDSPATRGALARDVQTAVAACGASRVIVEHVPYGMAQDPFPRWIVVPETLRRLVAEFGCGFVLDLAHARIAARALGMEMREYVAALPLDQLRELHVSGVLDTPDGLYDHGPLDDTDWAVLEWVMDEIRRGRWPAPWAVVLEYGGVSGHVYRSNSRPEVMAEVLPRLRDLVDRCNAALEDGRPSCATGERPA